MNDNTERIIGNCLEINSDIIRMKFEDDNKYPKFFIKIRENFYRYKLIKSVKKLEKANVPLNRNNLIELFAYIYSNFPPYGSYQNIKQVMHVDKEDMNIWKAIIRYPDNIVYSIDIDNEESTFTVVYIINDENNNSRITNTIYLTELITDKENLKEPIYNLNKLLIKITKDYILQTINSTKQIERKE